MSDKKQQIESLIINLQTFTCDGVTYKVSETGNGYKIKFNNVEIDFDGFKVNQVKGGYLLILQMRFPIIATIKLDFSDIPDEYKELFDSLLEQHNNDFDAVMKELVSVYAKRKATLARDGLSSSISNRITDAVEAQMDLNARSTKYILVGTGHNQEKVFFEKRALTHKKIANLGGFNLQSVTNWLKQGNNAEWVDTHNRDVLGLETDVSGGLTSKDVTAFNLKTSRSNRTAKNNPELIR